jgi:hypothetical protein
MSLIGARTGLRPNPSSSIRTGATNWRFSRKDNGALGQHAVSIAHDPFGWLLAFTFDTGTSPYDSPPHATTACPAISPSTPRLPRPTPNRNPWPPSARSTGIAAILKNRGTLWPTYRPDEGFRPASVTEPFLVDTPVASAWPASAGEKPGHGQHEYQKSLSPITVGGGMPSGTTPSIALPTEPACALCRVRGAFLLGHGWLHPAPTAASAPDSTLQSGSLRAIPIPTPIRPPDSGKTLPIKAKHTRISFHVGLLLCGVCFVAFDFFLQWSG